MSVAVDAIDRHDIRTLRRLLSEGLGPNSRGLEGETLLMRAAAWGTPDMLELLLSAGAEVDAKNELGFTALTCAAMVLSLEAVNILLDAGADPAAKTNDGQTALDIAKNSLRHQFHFAVPFTETHVVLSFPAWRVRHPVVERLSLVAVR